MVEFYVLNPFHDFTPDPVVLQSGASFSVETRIASSRIRLDFVWNGKYLYYVCDVVRDGRRVKRWYPGTDSPIVIENLFPNVYEIRDALLVVTDITGEGGDFHPGTVGDTHRILLMPTRREQR